MKGPHRYRSDQPGITSWHSFSAGAHYDPDNVAFGPVVGLDEHVVEPGAGFDWHRHRGVHIVSWVLDGTLRHEDPTGQVRLVTPGMLLVQSAGDGIRHAEANASDTEPLRFLQVTLLGEQEAARVRLLAPPVVVGGVRVDVRHGDFSSDGSQVLVHVVDGHWVGGVGPGDSIRASSGDIVELRGDGEMLILQSSAV